MKNKVLLLILDGMGFSSQSYGNAITQNTMPHLYQYMSQNSMALLEASGEAVGLASDQVGNSEVGHAAIGAGRVLKSKLAFIEDEFHNGNWAKSPFWDTLRRQQRIHIAGVLSGAGVHAHLNAMIQTIKLAVAEGIAEINLHVFLDGIDSPANSAFSLLDKLQEAIAPYQQVRIGVVMGRIWAADRSGDLAISRQCVGALYNSADLPEFSVSALKSHIVENGSERDFPAHQMNRNSMLKSGEHIILTNHRSDRVKQLCEVFSETQTVYTLADLTTLPDVKVFFPQARVDGGLVEQLIASGKSVEAVAEACKFKHVTYFINGFREFSEVSSTEIPTIDDQAIRLNPAMSIEALEVAVDKALGRDPDFMCVNIPNLDQVGHTGDLSLTEQAADFVDRCFQRVTEQALAKGYLVAVTADHGNADVMLNDAGEPQVSHSANPVPFLVLSPDNLPPVTMQPRGSLPNIAPTLLTLMGLTVPPFMHRDLLTD